MAISGAWLAAVTSSAGAEKWGTGWNPVHRINTMGPPVRRSEVPTGYGPGAAGQSNLPEEILDIADPIGGYTDEDFASALWGYGIPTGTAERPGLDVTHQDFRGNSDDFPPTGPTESGRPGGNQFRGEVNGVIRDDSKL